MSSCNDNLRGLKIDENRGRNRVCSDFSAKTRNNVLLFCLKTDREIDVINLDCRGYVGAKDIHACADTLLRFYAKTSH